MKKEISYFKNFGSKPETVDLKLMLGAIKEGAYRDEVKKLRKLNEIEYGEAKQRLPHFTPSGTFYEKRSKETLSEYSQLVVLDIDHIGVDAQNIREKAAQIEYTVAAFLSPGEKGVKILVNTDTSEIAHELAYNQVAQYYEKLLDVNVDTSGKDVSRACFVSWDPVMYFNENAKIFNVSSITEIPKFENVSVTTEPDNYQHVVDYTDKVCSYFPGNRNNYVYTLANNFNRAGINSFEAENYIMENYSEMAGEVPNTVKSAYTHTSEHGSLSIEYMYSASSARNASTANTVALKTPIIPAQVHKNLPELLQKGVSAFELPREKDIFLTGAIVILSGCFPFIEGLYDASIVYPNLNGFIIAPPSSGKGKLNYSRSLANSIHDEICAYYSLNSSFENKEDKKKMPVSLFIPADSSSAAVKQGLDANNGVGIICETEADTLSATFKQDWGGYSDIIRKAFHHEPVTYSRIGKKDKPIKLAEIQCPKISVCLSGTPNQVSGLIKSAEDGLFSRFLFYTFRNEGTPFFKNVFSKEGIQNHTEYFQTLSEVVYRNNKQLREKTGIKFHLTDDQENQFISHFNKTVKRIVFEFGEESDVKSIVIRLGLITFRIAMVLSIVRNFDNAAYSNEIVCAEVDFDNSISLSDIYLEHALTVYKTLPGALSIKQNAKSLYEFLPDIFEAKEAVTIGKTICGFADRSVANYLTDLKNIGWLKQPKTNGTYYKQDLQ